MAITTPRNPPLNPPPNPPHSPPAGVPVARPAGAPGVAATVLFQPGWVVSLRGVGGEVDPITGERRNRPASQVSGIGLIQQALWSRFIPGGEDDVVDRRVVMFAPVVDVHVGDEFISPEGHVWQAIVPGMPRGIPGRVPEYVAVEVTRRKERD